MSTTNGVRAALNQRSRTLVHGADRAGARAMLKAVGYDDDALAKPLIGVANTWTEIGPCNFHLRKLAVDVKRGIREAGGTPFEFNTISISDGITMGTEGMKGSLISREVIADSIELVAMSNMLDGVVALSACDKTIPGTIMALIRLDLPSLMLYGGTIYPGVLNGRDIDLVNVFEALGQFQAGQISYEELMDVENVACPGPGACGGQFTANTMAMISEIIGICPMGMGDVPAEDPAKQTVAFQAGELMLQILEDDIRPSQLLTRQSLENSLAASAATAGSTNSILHCLAFAREAGIDFTLDDIEQISRRTPIIGDMRPTGKYVALDLFKAGGVPILVNRLIDGGYMDGDTPTVTGQTLAQACADAVETPGQDVVRDLDDVISDSGGLVVLKGNLAPAGAVVKLKDAPPALLTGPARVFDTEEAAFEAVWTESADFGGRCAGHPLRGTGGRSGHARDAADHSGALRSRAGQQGRLDHRWAFQWRDARLDDRALRAGSGGRRSDRAAGRRRHDHNRCVAALDCGGLERRGVGGAAGSLECAGAELQQGRDGEVRASGVAGAGWRGDGGLGTSIPIRRGRSTTIRPRHFRTCVSFHSLRQ